MGMEGAVGAWQWSMDVNHGCGRGKRGGERRAGRKEGQESKDDMTAVRRMEGEERAGRKEVQESKDDIPAVRRMEGEERAGRKEGEKAKIT